MKPDILFSPAYMGLPINVFHPLLFLGEVYDDGSGIWFARCGVAVIATLVSYVLWRMVSDTLRQP